MPNDLDAIVGELREKLAVVAGSRGVYAQMDRFELWRDDGGFINPDNLLAKFACGDHAAYKALPAVASILGNLLPRLLDALTPPAAMPEIQTPAAGVEEHRIPSGYTAKTWAAKQAEVAEFSRRNPFTDEATGAARVANGEARLRAAASIQCSDVPDQFALVRRGDLSNVLGLLTRHRAGHERAIEERHRLAAEQPRKPDEDGERERLREALRQMETAGSRVSRLGAVTGPQWMQLSAALVVARSILGSGVGRP